MSPIQHQIQEVQRHLDMLKEYFKDPIAPVKEDLPLLQHNIDQIVFHSVNLEHEIEKATP